MKRTATCVASSDEESLVGCPKRRCIEKYYRDNPSLPVYEMSKRLRNYSVSDLLNILIERFSIEDKICCVTPTNVEHNCTFVVDQSCLKDPDDIKADDNGSWKNNGIHYTVVSWKNKKANILLRNSSSCKKHTLGSSEFLVERTYFTNKAHPDFKKLIIRVKG